MMIEQSYERIQVNGVQIGVIQYGTTTQNAPVLVLLHGFTGSAAGWGSLLEELAAPGRRVIALDMLGHGQSDAPDDPQRYSMEHCQADIISVLQTLGIKEGEAILLGYSMGGRIALYCAFSRYFRALILESASPGIANPVERGKRRVSDRALADRIEREGIEAFVDDWEELPLFASQRNLPIAYRRAQKVQRLNNRAHGLANSLRGVGTGVQPALEWRLSTLTIPVLLIAGERDSKFCTIGQYMAQQLLKAQLQIVPDTGHNVHLEQPERFLTLVHQFCDAIL
ncbi:MAG TPA: 2-succinyl-6-hydroxy-2,4-cyclohexadiene-1-carboxylate synthase [Ktedonobacteraceae bacterium]|jgi:2-succinyl-6-hydroxy-2,4-cyclohexadiene-1-carboxylate synthase